MQPIIRNASDLLAVLGMLGWVVWFALALVEKCS